MGITRGGSQSFYLGGGLGREIVLALVWEGGHQVRKKYSSQSLGGLGANRVLGVGNYSERLKH